MKTDIFIYDASVVSSDKEARKRVKEMCFNNNIKCIETSDFNKSNQDDVQTDIIIVHLGYITNRSISKIKNELNILRKNYEDSLILGVSSADNFRDEAMKNGVPSFSYSQLLNKLEKAIEVRGENTLKKVLKEIIDSLEYKNKLLQLFLPIDIDIQALEKLSKENKMGLAVKYLKEMLKGAEEVNRFADKFTEAKEHIGKVTDEGLKKKLNDLIGDDEHCSKLYGLLEIFDTYKEKVDDLDETNVQSMLNYFEDEVFESYHDWYCKLVE